MDDRRWGEKMGVYFNPNNESFTRDKNSKIYVDKTEIDFKKLKTLTIDAEIFVGSL